MGQTNASERVRTEKVEGEKKNAFVLHLCSSAVSSLEGWQIGVDVQGTFLTVTTTTLRAAAAFHFPFEPFVSIGGGSNAAEKVTEIEKRERED